GRIAGDRAWAGTGLGDRQGGAGRHARAGYEPRDQVAVGGEADVRAGAGRGGRREAHRDRRGRARGRQAIGAPGHTAEGGRYRSRPGDRAGARARDREGLSGGGADGDAAEVHGGGRGDRHLDLGDGAGDAGARALVAAGVQRGDRDVVGGARRETRQPEVDGLTRRRGGGRGGDREERRAGTRRGRRGVVDPIGREVCQAAPIDVGGGSNP